MNYADLRYAGLLGKTNRWSLKTKGSSEPFVFFAQHFRGNKYEYQNEHEEAPSWFYLD